MICSENLPMSECIQKNYDLAARLLLAKHIKPAELSDILIDSMEKNRSSISKAISWSIIKQFRIELETRCVFDRVIDIWPGFFCLCDRHNRKGHSRICSKEAVIIVEVDKFLKGIPRYFHSIPINQSFPKNTDENTKSQCTDKPTELSPTNPLGQSPMYIPGDQAAALFEKHSKLTMICVHPLRKTKIQLWCQKKGVIPFGEAHFPQTDNGKDTSIAEGHVRFMTKIKIGDHIGLSSPSGTLGGFVKMHGFNAFLTCAHVVQNKETLIAGNKSERHLSKTQVICFDKINPDLQIGCGWVFNEAFHYGNENETSVDAAVVILDEENVKIDQHDILNDTMLDAKSVDFLGNVILSFLFDIMLFLIITLRNLRNKK